VNTATVRELKADYRRAILARRKTLALSVKAPESEVLRLRLQQDERTIALLEEKIRKAGRS
jgi:hypothetical protein